MPTYEYACDRCGHQFELFQFITAKSVRKCPSCGQRSVKRLIGAGAGIIFKGSGFYQTDYRSESYKQAAKAEKDSSSGGKDQTSGANGKADKSETKTKSAEAAKPSAASDREN